MDFIQFGFLLLAFTVTTTGAYLTLHFLTQQRESRRIELASEIDPPTAVPTRLVSIRRRGMIALRFFARLSMPSSAEKFAAKNEPLRLRLMRAGLRGADMPFIYYGIKTLGAVMLVSAFGLAYWSTGAAFGAGLASGAVLVFAALGYYLPDIGIERLTVRRQRELAEHFPDALDLIRLCVESGLGLDAAVARVEKEVRVSSRVLHDELHMISLEMRAGASREQALKNLAERVGLEEIAALVAMLVQVERFGTSVADSLRIHSQTLRTKRRQRAEELAAKVPVKLLFPMIFCIFPALIVVLLGPAMIAVYHTFKPAIAG